MDNASAARDLPRICPFLHASVADGSVVEPVRWPDPANRCTALGDIAPQSLRQQEYACLASAHVNCPRFAKGVQLMAEAPRPGSAGVRFTPAILAALIVLAASFALSVGFVVANGGMELAAVANTSPQAGVASTAPSASPNVTPSAAAETAVPSPSSSIEAATAEPSPPETPTPVPSTAPTATPRPSSDRYALLEPCPDAPDCWIYEVREGDNLTSIANYFGVPLASVYERNPWAETEQLRAGQELRLPPPTR